MMPGNGRMPTAPRGLSKAGKALWRAVLEPYELDEHEVLLLKEACRVADRLDRLDAEAAAGTVTVTNHRGDQVAHPAMTEARQQAIVLTRILASLRLPSGDEDDGALSRPQRRGSARGAYGPRSVA